jgi:long-chain acyl-CoA synthetase
LDPFVILTALPYRIFRRVFFLGASEYFVTWYMRVLAKLSNIFPVDPDAHLREAMKIGAIGLRNDNILCIFPEGARSFDGELQEFKKGAAILAREIGVPIIPTAIHGTHEVWARDSRRIRLHKVRVQFGAPMRTSREAAPEAYTDDIGRLREEILEMLSFVNSPLDEN